MSGEIARVRYEMLKAIRNLSTIADYLTYKKVINYLKYLNDFRKRQIVTSSFPPMITFQASAYCNSNCRLCPVGLGIKGPGKGFLKFEVFSKVINEASEYLTTILFADWGEPFLNSDIFNMIEYAEAKRIITRASSNLLRFENEDDLKKLLDCGLSFLTISLHGVSRETYDAYQPNKNFQATVEKIKTLVSLKKQFKRKKPIIDLAFAITKKNEHELGKMQRFAEELGLTSNIYTASLNLRFYLNDPNAVTRMVSEWAQNRKMDLCKNTEHDKQKINELYEAIKKNNQTNLEALDKLHLTTRHFCVDPWESLTVNWNGTVSLCCTDYSKYVMGDINEESIVKIWNNEKYRYVRGFLLGKSAVNDVDFPCKYCLRY
jgi:MoaA/NifB/PqqE/SkfB family radical SAM enzyme